MSLLGTLALNEPCPPAFASLKFGKHEKVQALDITFCTFTACFSLIKLPAFYTPVSSKLCLITSPCSPLTAGILERSQKSTLAEQLLSAMAKRFGGSAKVWLKSFEAALGRDDGEAARKLLERAMLVLPQRKHVKVRPACGCRSRFPRVWRQRQLLQLRRSKYPAFLDTTC